MTSETNGSLSHDEIARFAYALWEARGGGCGLAEQDWLEAERQLQENQLQGAGSCAHKPLDAIRSSQALERSQNARGYSMLARRSF